MERQRKARMSDGSEEPGKSRDENQLLSQGNQTSSNERTKK
jgi:hypothetical protein